MYKLMDHCAWTRAVSKDLVEEFKIYVSRQGWTVTGALTQESDLQVLRRRWRSTLAPRQMT